MKDKLIEMIIDGFRNCTKPHEVCSQLDLEALADHLIANGVTVATDNNDGGKWTPANEMLPTYTSDYLVYLVKPFEGKLVPLGSSIAAYIARDDCWDLPDPYIVTHWMHLPEAPKEVE